ncbi:MAG: DUF2203 domain-containing protein [candidate division NC10 bacterium]|nr:DUF2203 domain-containing protein [candidate division NC10 bacterium]
MPPKLFTLAQANSLLPHLVPRLRQVIAAREALRTPQATMEDFRTRAMQHGGAQPTPALHEAKLQIDRLTAAVRDEIGEIESLGCLVKDLDLGLVDFPAKRGEETVLLCWRLGEASIRYWHGTDEGYAGRKPLEEDPVD